MPPVDQNLIVDQQALLHDDRKALPQAERGTWALHIIELKPHGPEGADIVWEWHAWDHLIQDHDPEKPNYGDPSEHPERIWVEANGRGASAFCSSLPKRGRTTTA